MKHVYIKRKLESKILRFLESPEIIALVGARQCGKTTLLRHLSEQVQEQSVFLTFDDKSVLAQFERDTSGFIEKYVKPNKYIFIDEFQYSRHGGKILKFIYDTHHAKFLVSGSSAIDLTVKATKYLVGRILTFTLYPLDFEEFLSFRDAEIHKLYSENRISLSTESKQQHPQTTIDIHALQNLYEEFTIFGGYPRVVTSQEVENKIEILKAIYNTFFLREVKDVLGLIEDFKLERLVRALALQTANLIQYNELGEVAELAHPTIKKYLNFLEKTFICRFVRPYFKNRRAELVKNPKVFFLDSGLRNAVVDNFAPLDEREDAGAMLENSVASQLMKYDLRFQYWRTKKQREVDFVVELPGQKLAAIEVKKTLRTSDINTLSIKEFTRAYPQAPLSYAYYQTFLNNQNDISQFPCYLL